MPWSRRNIDACYHSHLSCIHFLRIMLSKKKKKKSWQWIKKDNKLSLCTQVILPSSFQFVVWIMTIFHHFLLSHPQLPRHPLHVTDSTPMRDGGKLLKGNPPGSYCLVSWPWLGVRTKWLKSWPLLCNHESLLARYKAHMIRMTIQKVGKAL